MSFSPEWEVWYQTHQPILGWHPNLVKLIAVWVAEAEKVLELGPGSGGNIQFILDQGWDYHGIEGSETAVRTLQKQYPRAKIIWDDFTALESAAPEYDLVIDRAAIPHNDLAGISMALNFAYQSLKPGGLLISSDWFSASHSESGRFDFTDGQFAGVGRVHFSDEEELTDLFKDFDRLFIEERITRRPKSGGFLDAHFKRHNISQVFDEYQSAVWDLVCRKPYE